MSSGGRISLVLLLRVEGARLEGGGSEEIEGLHEGR
jgi:hypothetical protein